MKEKHADILIIDDEKDIANLLCNILKSHNYNVNICFDGVTGIKTAKETLPDLILLDYQLPVKDGKEVCRELKTDEKTKYIPIIILTAQTDTKIKQACYNYGADEFINKPFETVDLLSRVKAMLRIKFLQDNLLNTNKILNELVNEKTEELERIYTNAIMSLARAIEAKDKYTRYHSFRVAKYATLIAQELGLGENEIDSINKAGEFHDLGKLAVPDNILNKKEKLTDEDWEFIKKHPEASVNIIGPELLDEKTLLSIKQHHEKYDGTGYPSGIKGNNIHIGARIIAVADAYEAMTSDRPYRKALPKGKVIEELNKNAGKHFDPQIVNIFWKVIKKI